MSIHLVVSMLLQALMQFLIQSSQHPRQGDSKKGGGTSERLSDLCTVTRLQVILPGIKFWLQNSTTIPFGLNKWLYKKEKKKQVWWAQSGLQSSWDQDLRPSPHGPDHTVSPSSDPLLVLCSSRPGVVLILFYITSICRGSWHLVLVQSMADRLMDGWVCEWIHGSQ